ncbi:histone chaperone Rttp106-like-domain-containing protein [Infundibulicybe gibba]|nr:histone chaperone Rttp106-like-domain-containing protein [Infundibulicybe gibba]
MTSPVQAPYYHSACSSLPNELALQIREICLSASHEATLDLLIRFIIGAECPDSVLNETRTEWASRQQLWKNSTQHMTKPVVENKRPREEEVDSESSSQTAKRQRIPSSEATTEPTKPPLSDDPPKYTLHSVSATSPVRKKVDITIHESSIAFTNPTSRAIEATIPLSSMQRAFILPTRGKQKPHWSVILLSSDTPDRGKSPLPANSQIIFGIDATTTSPMSTTIYSGAEPTKSTLPKGSPTISAIRELLSHVGIPILEPTSAVFKSACAGAGSSAREGGVPGIEAYRSAKAGSLWFMSEGILWGESKPCEFWAVEDLISKSEGVRMISATGRTCSVILTRKSSKEEEIGEDEDDIGIETEFGMVDGREQDGINQWARQHRHLFGKKKVAQDNGQPVLTIHQVGADSDESDEDFELDSDDEDGNLSSSSVSSDESNGDEKDAQESDAEGSGLDADGEDADDEPLKAENHPLMKPGAMRRMSRAAIDMVVDMVEGDAAVSGGDIESDEEDQLED